MITLKRLRPPEQGMVHYLDAMDKYYAVRNWIPGEMSGEPGERPGNLLHEIFIVLALFLLCSTLFIIFSLALPESRKAPVYWPPDIASAFR
ncbi:MAG TPA: hypothetical protein V6C52_00650 [Coleofasciculaceae cyanobacterium]|jgi:hypothetical protein